MGIHLYNFLQWAKQKLFSLPIPPAALIHRKLQAKRLPSWPIPLPNEKSQFQLRLANGPYVNRFARSGYNLGPQRNCPYRPLFSRLVPAECTPPSGRGAFAFALALA